jgi:hypothetical protein
VSGNRDRKRSTLLRCLAIAGVILITTVGWVVADTLTRPLDVQLLAHIDVYGQDEKGVWVRVDEIGPANLRFDANLVELARGKKIGSGFEFRTRSREGKDYSVRLADDADVTINPASGRFDADLAFEVTYGGKTARVVARPTTETRFGPGGAALRGQRARGVLGHGPSTFTLVSVNELALDDEAPLFLVSQERYTMTPRD